MDVVTHAMLGTLAGSPWLASHPEASASFVLGSVAPDLDALSRLFGKRAFLRWHQTWTHSIPLIVSGAMAGTVLLTAAGSEFRWLPLFVAAGMLFHTLLDVTNTYGVTIWAPLSGRRVCLEWIFFIDAAVIVACLAGIAALAGFLHGALPVPSWIGIGTMAFMAAYWFSRALVYRRAGRLAPKDTETLIPSALWPWRFFGTRPHNGRVELFQLNALNGRKQNEGSVVVYDEAFQALLDGIPEFRMMRELSAAYHVVEVSEAEDATAVVCCDLRTRNFNSEFGRIDARVHPDGTITDVQFHV